MAFFPEFAESMRSLLELARTRPVLIVGHARPDGDCIGSQIGLARILRAAGAHVVCTNADPVPRRFDFMVGASDFVPVVPGMAQGHTVVFVDCADAVRPNRRVLDITGTPHAQIDHHLSNDSYATSINILNTQAAATAEIIAGCAIDLGLEIDATAAQALYAGILTDTGRFCFPNTTKRVLELAGELVDRGAGPSVVAGLIYERETPGNLSLLQRFLASFRYELGGLVCIGRIDRNAFTETGTTAEDTEGLVDYARAIEGVEIGVLLEDRGGETKGSLRAKDPALRVDLIAAQFNGGGHACAAGFRVQEPPEALVERLVSVIQGNLRAAGRLP
jgi:phosphoesterase RecJ-like protein